MNTCCVAGSLMGAYAVCETAVTAWFRWTGRGYSEWFFEESGRTVHFDPVSGYRLTQVPSRWARITSGVVEYTGTLYGNRQGFPHAHDYTVQRDPPDQRRIAVLGDSFTAARFLAVNWPDRAEQELARAGHPIELMNFSVDGGGLANWWSVLTRLIGPQGYQLDGVVFTVFDNDLYRRFLFAEDRGFSSHMYGRSPGWDRADLPGSLEDAQPRLRSAAGSHIVSSAEFDAVLRGRRPASVPRPALRPVIARLVWHLMLHYFHPVPLPDHWEAGQIAMMTDIRAFLEARRIPAVVIYLPSRAGLLQGAPGLERATRDFSSRIGAEFWDGAQPFRALPPRRIRSDFFPYDAHWNQSGSDLFATFIAPRLDEFVVAAR